MTSSAAEMASSCACSRCREEQPHSSRCLQRQQGTLLLLLLLLLCVFVQVFCECCQE
jgi:hypothetical protein